MCFRTLFYKNNVEEICNFASEKQICKIRKDREA